MLLAEICTYLAANGVGTAGVDLFYGELKELYPDVMTLVREYPGMQTEPNLGDSGITSGTLPRLEYPSIHILFRGVRDDYDGPRVRAEVATKALLKILNSTLSGVRYLAVEPATPFPLPADDNFRTRISVSARVTKEPS